MIAKNVVCGLDENIDCPLPPALFMEDFRDRHAAILNIIFFTPLNYFNNMLDFKKSIFALHFIK